MEIGVLQLEIVWVWVPAWMPFVWGIWCWYIGYQPCLSRCSPASQCSMRLLTDKQTPVYKVQISKAVGRNQSCIGRPPKFQLFLEARKCANQQPPVHRQMNLGVINKVATDISFAFLCQLDIWSLWLVPIVRSGIGLVLFWNLLVVIYIWI